MTYDSFDNFLTLAITALIYGTALWLVAAFAIFVATHNLASNDSDRPSNSEPAPQEEVLEQLIQAPITAEPEVAPPIQTAASESLSTEQITIACEPVDFTCWTAADLRDSRLRQSFSIPLRAKGQTRAYRKTELEALYYQAMASTA